MNRFCGDRDSNGRYSAVFVVSIILLLFGAVNNSAQTPEDFQKTKSTRVAPELLSGSFATVSALVEPAVVNIDTKGRIETTSVRKRRSEEESNPFDDLMRRFPRPSYSVGSGFFVDSRGYILTNYHVVEEAASITVRLPNGEEYDGKIVGADEMTDLAVLKITRDEPFPFLKLGNSDDLSIGEWVLAIGSPFGLEQTVTAGIISQLDRETPSNSNFQHFIQTDAAINRGNSGGPLVNMKGEVIGINSQIATSTGDYNGIGFALPANDARNVFDQIIEYGKVKRGFLGIGLDSVKKEFASVYGLPEAKGAIITEIVDSKSAAARAGLKPGDIVVAINGTRIKGSRELIELVGSLKPGTTVRVSFYREIGMDVVPKTISVKLDERPADEIYIADDSRRKLSIDGGKRGVLVGLEVEDPQTLILRRYRIKRGQGVVIKKVNPRSYLADLKSKFGDEALLSGDLLVRINRRNVNDVANYEELIKDFKPGNAIVFHILRYDREQRVVIPMIVQFTSK